MRPVRSIAVAAALLLPLAVHAGGFRCPAKGGPAWREVRSAHFVLQTDLSSGKAKDLARDLERIHETIRHGLFRNPPPVHGALRVVAFRDKEDFGLFAPEKAAAYYLPAEATGEPTIVMPAVFGEYQRIVVAHELTHYVLARVFVRQPRWFGEGVAGFMESVAQTGAGATPTVGGVPAYLYRTAYPYHGGVREVLLAKDGLADARQYAVAWALVHYLVNAHAPEFAALQGRLARAEDPGAAWNAVFPQWRLDDPDALEALDKQIGLHLSRGKFGFRDVKLPPQPEVTERALTSAEVHALRLSLPWINRGKDAKDVRGAEIAEALAEDPGHVEALRAKAELEPEGALALAERATAAHPEDPRAWSLLAARLPQDATGPRLAALRKAVELAPDRAYALNELAWALLGAGESGAALPLARKAAFLQPGDAAILDTLAGVLEDLGQCPEALGTQRRAVDVLPEGIEEAARKPYLERIARLEQACGAPAPARAP